MKNTILLFTTILLCAVQPAYCIEKKGPEKIIEKLFDQPGFFESSRPINTSDPTEKAVLLSKIKNDYKKHNGCTIPKIYLNAIDKNLLNAHRTKIIIPDNQDQ